MSHALIIDDNMVISRAIESRLASLGFDSFDRTWAHHQAVEAAAHHVPDLIVVGDAISDGSPMDVAREIALTCDAPVLMVTSGRIHLERRQRTGARVAGPFHVTQLDRALESARQPESEIQLHC